MSLDDKLGKDECERLERKYSNYCMGLSAAAIGCLLGAWADGGLYTIVSNGLNDLVGGTPTGTRPSIPSMIATATSMIAGIGALVSAAYSINYQQLGENRNTFGTPRESRPKPQLEPVDIEDVDVYHSNQQTEQEKYGGYHDS